MRVLSFKFYPHFAFGVSSFSFLVRVPGDLYIVSKTNYFSKFLCEFYVDFIVT